MEHIDNIRCAECGKVVATGGNVVGIYTWFAFCQKCIDKIKRHIGGR